MSLPRISQNALIGHHRPSNGPLNPPKALKSARHHRGVTLGDPVFADLQLLLLHGTNADGAVLT